LIAKRLFVAIFLNTNESHTQKEGNMPRQLYNPAIIDDSDKTHGRTQHVVIRKAMPIGFDTRESNIKMVFGTFNDVSVIGYEPATHNCELNQKKKRGISINRRKSIGVVAPVKIAPAVTSGGGGENEGEKAMKVVQVLAKGTILLQRLAPNVCEVTIFNYFEDKGE